MKLSSLVIAGEKLAYSHHPAAAPTRTPPLVLVHGAGGNALHWPVALRRLPDCAVYALDLPGHGRSTGQGRRAIADYAAVVTAFADALDLPAFVLAGHSMGGAIALECALRNATRLAGLILVATGARLRVAPRILDAVANDFPAAISLLAELAHGAQVDPQIDRIFRRRLGEVAPAILHGDFLACDAFDRRADLAAVAVPTLVICGSADRMTPVQYSRFLAEKIAAAQLVIVPDVGHMVMLEKQALPVVVQAIRAFLARC